MGKTVGTILLVAVAIVVNVIPGVGQAISGTLVSAGLGAAAAASVTAALTTVITSLAVGAIASLLRPTPKFDQPETARSPIKTSIPPRVSAYGETRLYGAYVLYENTTYSVGGSEGGYSPYALDVFAVHDGPIDAIVQRYLGDDKITKTGANVNPLPNNQYRGPTTTDVVHWYETLGQTPGTAFAEIVSKLPGKWTNNHRGDGVVALGIVWKPVKMENFSETFPYGAVAASIAARWQKVYDPRDGAQDVSDPTTWVWSANAALHLLHYRLVREKARRASGAVFPDGAALQDAWDLFFQPTVAYWIEAANVCDENVALNAGGTEKRYRSCFSHRHTDPHKTVIDGLTACFDGWTSPRADGALVVYAGKYYAPTVDIGPDEIVSYSWQYGVVDEEAVNDLKITYISKTHEYTTVDADPWRDTDDITERGALRAQGVDFHVPSHGQARRLAKRLVSRIMANNRGVITTNVAGRIVRGQRYINLRVEEAGAVFFDGVAEITGMTRNLATGGVTFSWVEVSENIDAWNPATEEGEPAPLNDRIVLIAPPAPIIDTAVLLFDAPSTGGTGARIQITLSGPGGDDLTWFARWRKVGDPVWNEQRYLDVDSSAGVTLITGFVPVDDDLEVEVAYRSGTGAISPWSSPATEVTTDTTSVAPDAATAITLVNWSNTMDLSTPTIPRATSYRWRFYESDGVTLKRTIVTALPSVTYTKAQAHADGVERAYKVDVAGVNSSGTGAAIMSGLLTNDAPAAVTGVAAANGDHVSSVTFTPLVGVADLGGYLIAWGTASGFDPQTQGSSIISYVSPGYINGLAAGTYYAKVAAFDLWTQQPDQLNFSAADAFTINIGSGGEEPPDGGSGGNCVTADTPILMADGTEKPAGELVVGDMVRTQHEQTFEWGDFPVTHVSIVPCDDVWEALGVTASADHRLWVNGWARIADIGTPADPADVVKITVDEAHTYYSRGVLSHNIKTGE